MSHRAPNREPEPAHQAFAPTTLTWTQSIFRLTAAGNTGVAGGPRRDLLLRILLPQADRRGVFDKAILFAPYLQIANPGNGIVA